jgi:hypothetical protein
MSELICRQQMTFEAILFGESSALILMWGYGPRLL